MKFYIKRSDHSDGLYNFLLIIGFTVLFLAVTDVMSVSAGTYKTKFHFNSKSHQLKQDSIIYKGRVLDEKDKPMAGVTVKIAGSNKVINTNSQGEFFIFAMPKENLEFTYIGYQVKYLSLNVVEVTQPISVRMIPGENSLGEVAVSNGYQDVSKLNSTGSYEVVTKQQLQHSSDPNLIKRLEGITTGMDFGSNSVIVNSANPAVAKLNGQFNNSALAKLSIRGKTTLNPFNSTNDVSGLVMVVIDGIPSPYSIDNINPNDVESITILKDAAASSIWGARAANGVIVVKTKHGAYNKPLNISFNSNFNVSDKPDAFYHKTMSTSELVDAQSFQFNAANTIIDSANLTQPQPFYSPVAEILNQQKMGAITPTQAISQLNALRGNDVRRDYDKYLFRDAFTQSYSLGIDGGGEKMTYRLSGNYDNLRNNTIGSAGERLSVTYNTSLRLLKNLELNANINFSQRTSQNQAQEDDVSGTLSAPFYLYTRLANDQGIPQSISYKYRPDFVNLLASAYGDNILGLDYTPLQNMRDGYINTRSRSVNINLGANYKINSVFSANVLYNYNRGRSAENILNNQNSFYMRDLITQYTAPADYFDPLYGPQPFLQQIPLGGLYRPTLATLTKNFFRGQIDAKKNWGDKHQFEAVAGVDLSQSSLVTQIDQYYGFDEKALTNTPQVNYNSFSTPLFLDASGAAALRIPYSSGFSNYKLRNYSIFSNAFYTYNKLYTFSASIRKDFSSEFGIKGEEGATPFYSFGGKWNIAGEGFYKSFILPVLQFRVNYGTTGTSNSRINGMQSFSLPLGALTANNQIKPSKTGMLNLGLDFGSKNNRITGSLEYYDKRTTSYFTNNIIDPISGILDPLNINNIKLHTRGADVIINSMNLQAGLFSWTSNLLFSYNRVKTDKSVNQDALTAGSAIGDISNNIPGYDVSQIFAFRWAGLDPSSGSPRGYVNGVPTVVNDAASYALISNQAISTAHYFGSAIPVYFGSFRNTLRYGAFSLAANITYKLGYFFRRPVSDLVQYNSLFSNGLAQGAEYSQRWQKAGDELTTNVPSMIYPASQQRDNFYRYSDINVQKGDHVRLQEVNLSYTLNKRNWFLKNPRLYANITNLGIIWRSNKLGIDPDVYDYPAPRTYSLGLSANF